MVKSVLTVHHGCRPCNTSSFYTPPDSAWSIASPPLSDPTYASAAAACAACPTNVTVYEFRVGDTGPGFWSCTPTPTITLVLSWTDPHGCLWTAIGSPGTPTVADLTAPGASAICDTVDVTPPSLQEISEGSCSAACPLDCASCGLTYQVVDDGGFNPGTYAMPREIIFNCVWSLLIPPFGFAQISCDPINGWQCTVAGRDDDDNCPLNTTGVPNRGPCPPTGTFAIPTGGTMTITQIA